MPIMLSIRKSPSQSGMSVVLALFSVMLVGLISTAVIKELSSQLAAQKKFFMQSDLEAIKRMYRNRISCNRTLVYDAVNDIDKCAHGVNQRMDVKDHDGNIIIDLLGTRYGDPGWTVGAYCNSTNDGFVLRAVRLASGYTLADADAIGPSRNTNILLADPLTKQRFGTSDDESLLFMKGTDFCSGERRRIFGSGVKTASNLVTVAKTHTGMSQDVKLAMDSINNDFLGAVKTLPGGDYGLVVPCDGIWNVQTQVNFTTPHPAVGNTNAWIQAQISGPPAADPGMMPIVNPGPMQFTRRVSDEAFYSTRIRFDFPDGTSTVNYTREWMNFATHDDNRAQLGWNPFTGPFAGYQARWKEMIVNRTVWLPKDTVMTLWVYGFGLPMGMAWGGMGIYGERCI